MSEKINNILNNSELTPEEKLELISSFNDSIPDEFQQIESLLNSEKWPEAVLEFQIADENSEEDKADRAEGIVDILVEESLENKKFLDFGCGEGHASKYASEVTSVSVGYDIKKQGDLSWEKDENFLLTTDFEKVKEKGLFDIVLVYDVLDHAEDPVDVLRKVETVLNPNGGKVYLRCHPWSGRHGGHCYRKLNKAFVHLVCSEEELKSLGCDVEFNSKVLFPLARYGEYFKEVNLHVLKQDIEEQAVEEDFFRDNVVIRDRILKLFDSKRWSDKCPVFQMSQCFVDYILKKNV